MIEFGRTLRTARESKGYTVSQIAEMTHIKPSVVDGLEKEDFSAIAAPIYGRGFVKLYCEAVGLEAKPLVDEFMAIMNGEHEIAIKERPVTVAEPDAPDDTPPPPLKPAAEPDLFAQEEPAAVREPAPIPAAPLASAAPAVPAAEPTPDISRYASPFRTEDRTPPSFPDLPWRLILLVIVGLVLLALLVCGIRALYCATAAEPASAEPVAAEPVAAKPTAAETESPATEPESPATQSAAKPAARVQQQGIPPLYID